MTYDEAIAALRDKLARTIKERQLAANSQREVTEAAIAWHVHHSGEDYLDTPERERMARAVAAVASTERLHAAVAALLDDSEAVA